MRTDVAVIGAGPAGLLCALWLARQGVKVSIFEKRGERPTRGRADGFEPRTLEILNSFGLLDSWWRDANRTVELSVWVARQKKPLERILRRCNSAQGTSDFFDVTMDQAVLARAIEAQLYSHHGIAVQYGCESLELKVGARAASQWPVQFRIRQAGRVVDVSAKYVVGADGANSWTREQAGVDMNSSPTDQIWGVADIHALTDFPDIRSRCIVHAEQAGTMMTIPRESGMVRIYVQLGDKSNTTITNAADIVAAAQRIISPYKLTHRHCYWWSRYRVKQGLAKHFAASTERILLIGDAVHTHSPKAGMGLNISLQDAFNLGWKLAAVIRGKAHPRLLTTYEEERRPVAEFLVNFDREFLQIFHTPLSGMSIDQYRDAVIAATTKEHAALSGVSVSYHDNSMFDDTRLNQSHLAPGISFGARMPPGVVVNHSDGRSRTVHDILPSNGKWRLVVFPGDIRDARAMGRYRELAHDMDRNLSVCVAPSVIPDSELDIVTVHHSPRHEIELLELPALYHPWDDDFGWDYHKVFSDERTPNDPENTGKAYGKYGIADDGCAVLLRPDQHVCMISTMDETAQLCRDYLKDYMLLERVNPATADQPDTRARL